MLSVMRFLHGIQCELPMFLLASILILAFRAVLGGVTYDDPDNSDDNGDNDEEENNSRSGTISAFARLTAQSKDASMPSSPLTDVNT